MTEIMLGMPGPWAEDYREESDHYTTKIGGLPDWPTQDMLIGPAVLNCGLCGERLCLVAQVYAPISIPKLNIKERVIYIFGCWVPKCSSNRRSWRAIRVQKCDDEKLVGVSEPKTIKQGDGSVPIPKRNKYEDDILSFESDDNDDDVDLEELSLALSKATLQASQSRPNGISVQSKEHLVSKLKSADADPKKPVVPCFYIYYERAQCPSSKSVASSTYSVLPIEGHENPLDVRGDGEIWEEENYEYDRALCADRTYLKFKKQLALYPEQCFRYSPSETILFELGTSHSVVALTPPTEIFSICKARTWGLCLRETRYSYGGKPLLATKEFVEPDRCSLCGSSRHFEMQLMSPLLYFLHQAADGLSTYVPEEWSWITLILYTCTNSCCPSLCKKKSGSCCWAVAEEAVIVQDE